MTQRRWSLGSTWMAGDEEMPREAFQRLRDSSFWSGWVDVRRKLQGTGKTKGTSAGRVGNIAKRWEMLAREEKWGMFGRVFPYRCGEEILDIIVG